MFGMLAMFWHLALWSRSFVHSRVTVCDLVRRVLPLNMPLQSALWEIRCADGDVRCRCWEVWFAGQPRWATVSGALP